LSTFCQNYGLSGCLKALQIAYSPRPFAPCAWL
jgi:hypothetical protein